MFVSFRPPRARCRREGGTPESLNRDDILTVIGYPDGTFQARDCPHGLYYRESDSECTYPEEANCKWENSVQRFYREAIKSYPR